jgi:ATP-dependent DNA ligase
MAATLTQERFTGPEWIFERKFDGLRLLAYKKGSKVELFSRNRLPQNIPALARAIAKLPHRELILDGEIDWHALSGTHGFSRAAYHVFDILWIDGRDATTLPLEERQALLKKLPVTPPLHRVTALRMSVPGAVATGSSDNLSVHHEAPWERAQREGWEGVIAKRRGSIYEPRRSPNWLKMKVELSQEFVVGGFTDPQGKRVGLGALLVGYYEYASASEPPVSSPSGRGRVRVRSLATNDKLSSHSSERERRSSTTSEGASGSAQPDFVFAGKIGTGFDTKLLLELRARLDALELPASPFTKAIGLPRVRAHWVRPEIVVQVGFIEWTVHGKLRHPRLLGVRTDKTARDVVKEMP